MIARSEQSDLNLNCQLKGQESLLAAQGLNNEVIEGVSFLIDRANGLDSTFTKDCGV